MKYREEAQLVHSQKPGDSVIASDFCFLKIVVENMK